MAVTPTSWLDVVVDLSAVSPDAATEALRILEREQVEKLAAAVFVLTPPGHQLPAGHGFTRISRKADEEPASVLRRVFRGVAVHQNAVLVVSGPMLPSMPVVGALQELLEEDPLFGFAIPRFATADGSGVVALPGREAGEPAGPLPRRVLPELPRRYITPEFFAACILVRSEVVRNLDASDAGYRSTAGLMLELMCRARRLGFRVAVGNKAVVIPPGAGVDPYPRPPAEDRALLRERYPDAERAATWLARMSARTREALLGCVHSPRPAERRSILLDARGMREFHNGTSEAILGMLDGLAEMKADRTIEVLAGGQAAAFHGLRNRYPGFRFVYSQPTDRHAAAVRLSQPWSRTTIAELHQHALVLVVSILDTIAWDVLYLANDETEPTWRLAARYADAIVYDSDFTRRRFAARFPVAPSVREVVNHYSLHPDEHAPASTSETTNGGHILLFGNDYDHKNVRETSAVLSDAFPEENVTIVGLGEVAGPRTRSLASGAIPPAELDQLFATASLIVFPSFYEGFGLPVVKGVSYGRTVVARRSGLLQEIAGRCRGAGRIVPFDDTLSLVEAIGRVKAGLPVETIPVGGGLGAGEEPPRWRDAAERLLGLVDELISRGGRGQWDERDAALRLVFAGDLP